MLVAVFGWLAGRIAIHFALLGLRTVIFVPGLSGVGSPCSPASWPVVHPPSTRAAAARINKCRTDTSPTPGRHNTAQPGIGRARRNGFLERCLSARVAQDLPDRRNLRPPA